MKYIIITLIILIIIIIIIFKMYSKKKLNVNDLNIIKRDKEKINLINELLKNKRKYFTDDEIKVLSNKFQFYENDKNITSEILKIPDEKDVISNVEIIKTVNTNPAYNVILNKFKENGELDYNDIKFLKNTDINNFYYDLYGNKIIANIKDYYADYMTTIDEENPKTAMGVKIQKGQSGMIIPDMYPIWKYQTSAYNIDWSRIENPLAIY